MCTFQLGLAVRELKLTTNHKWACQRSFNCMTASQYVLFRIFCLDRRFNSLQQPVISKCLFDTNQEIEMQMSQDGPVWRQSFNADEVNHIDVSSNGRIIASADDSGQIAIVDIAAKSLVRTLKGGHTNIASSVAFPKHKEWRVVSAGLDSQLLLWDYSSGRPLKRWKVGIFQDSIGLEESIVKEPALCLFSCLNHPCSAMN